MSRRDSVLVIVAVIALLMVGFFTYRYLDILEAKTAAPVANVKVSETKKDINVTTNNDKSTSTQPVTTQKAPAPPMGSFEAPPASMPKVNGNNVTMEGSRCYFQTNKGRSYEVTVTLKDNEVALISALHFNQDGDFGSVRILTKSQKFYIQDGDVRILTKNDLENILRKKFEGFRANPDWALARADTLSNVNPKDYGLVDIKVVIVNVN